MILFNLKDFNFFLYFLFAIFFFVFTALDAFVGRDQDWTPTVLAKVTDAQQSARACRPGDGGDAVGCGDPAAGCFSTSLACPPWGEGRGLGGVFFFGVL